MPPTDPTSRRRAAHSRRPAPRRRAAGQPAAPSSTRSEHHSRAIRGPCRDPAPGRGTGREGRRFRRHWSEGRPAVRLPARAIRGRSRSGAARPGAPSRAAPWPTTRIRSSSATSTQPGPSTSWGRATSASTSTRRTNEPDLMAAWVRTGFGQMQAHAVRDLELDRRSSAGCDACAGRTRRTAGWRPTSSRSWGGPLMKPPAYAIQLPEVWSMVGADPRRAGGAGGAPLGGHRRCRRPRAGDGLLLRPGAGAAGSIALNGAVAGHDPAGGTRAWPDARPGGGGLRRSPRGGCRPTPSPTGGPPRCRPIAAGSRSASSPSTTACTATSMSAIAWAASTPLAEPG